MDYIINLNTLDSRKSEFETMKSSIETLVSSYNSSYLNGLSGTEISGIASKTKETFDRLDKGYNNSNTWLNNYLKEINELENNLGNFSDDNMPSITEFKGEFVDMFGKKVIPLIRAADNGESVSVEGDKVIVYKYSGGSFYVANTELSIDEYTKYLQDNNMTQSAGLLPTGCNILSCNYAIDMLSGEYTSYSDMAAQSKGATSLYSERCASANKQDVLNYCYQELEEGHPVMIQVKSYGYARHFVTMVGYSSDVKSASDLNADNILIIDPNDGKVQTLGESGRDLITYDGVYVANGPSEEYLNSINN